MTDLTVALIGYYGRGNFGDDVLLRVAYRISRESWPDATISIRLAEPAPYLERLLQGSFKAIPFGTRDEYDVLVHGGGGTFFDFGVYGAYDKWVNRILLAAGDGAFVSAQSLIRRALGRRLLSGKTRLGFGIGVGTFANGSKRLRDALCELADFDALWVRDRQSVENLAALGICVNTVEGSDLAFLWHHWCPEEMFLRAAARRRHRPALGVILRDWPDSNQARFAIGFADRVRALQAHYDLTLFVLDASTDAGVQAVFADLPSRVWSPQTKSLNSYLEEMASQDIFLTSRAHGAICGACLGRPSVLLDIEPKLQTIHRMLPNATYLAGVEIPPKELVSLVDAAIGTSSDMVADDVQANVERSRIAHDRVLDGASG